MASIGADGQLRAYFKCAIGSFSFDAGDLTVFLQQVGCLVLHEQAETWEPPSFFRQVIQKIPLRHQRDKFAVYRQVRQIADLRGDAAEATPNAAVFLMRPLQKSFEQAELVHYFECRRMNRIAAKIAQKIAMLLQHNHIDARSRQKITGHHSSGTSANDATSSA